LCFPTGGRPPPARLPESLERGSQRLLEEAAVPAVPAASIAALYADQGAKCSFHCYTWAVPVPVPVLVPVSFWWCSNGFVFSKPGVLFLCNGEADRRRGNISALPHTHASATVASALALALRGWDKQRRMESFLLPSSGAIQRLCCAFFPAASCCEQ
jgi:hypothetical protein